MNNYKCIIVIIIFLIIILYLNDTKETFSNNINPLNKYFDNVYVITVPDRKKYMKNTIKYFDINATIIDATLKKNIDYTKLQKENFFTEEYYSEQNEGRIACHFSQIKLIKEFLNSKDETIFIFEDDILKKKNENFNNIVKDAMNNIPEDWDIVYFGRCWDKCKKMIKVKNSKNLYRVFSPKCRHAYGLTRKGATKILKYTIPMTNNGDELYSKNIENGNIIAYAVHPSIFSQNRKNLGSNLGNDYKKINHGLRYLFLKFINKINKKFTEYPPTCS